MQQAVPEPAIGFALSMSIASALMKRAHTRITTRIGEVVCSRFRDKPDLVSAITRGANTTYSERYVEKIRPTPFDRAVLPVQVIDVNSRVRLFSSRTNITPG